MTNVVTTPMGRRRGRWIDDWDPEDATFWERGGNRIANRNLAASIFSEHLGFSVWTLWAMLVLFMTPENGFGLTVPQKFLLTSMVTLVGSILRVPYTLAVPRFGGRNWTVFNSFVLLVPVGLAAYIVTQPHAPFLAFALLAVVAGCGGANFSSSMTNINQFFPERRKGAGRSGSTRAAATSASR